MAEISVFTMPNGWPLYFATEEYDLDAISKHALDQGHVYYYVLATKKQAQHLGGNTTVLFKVIKAFCGSAVVECEDYLGLTEGSEEAVWDLPKIPRAMVDRIEAFFRAVDDRHKTEAIVMLGYDTRRNGSDGWCVLVPNQENTAGSCDYKYESVVEEKDEEIVIVGSAHSHPGMTAFASGTDHKDQATFDGLHITYGWFGRRIEYHLELTMGGRSFTFLEDQIFESPPSLDEPEDLTEWMGKVKKRYGYTTPTTTGVLSTEFYGNIASNPKRKTPSGWPDWTEAVCIIELLPNQKTCPLCRIALKPDEFDKRRCEVCHGLFCFPNESWEAFHSIRRAQYFSKELDRETTPYGIYIMRQTPMKQGNQEWVDQKPEWIVELPGKA